MPNMWSRRIRTVPNKDRKLSAIRLLPRRKRYLYDYTYPGEVLGDKEVLINNFINYKFKKGN